MALIIGILSSAATAGGLHWTVGIAWIWGWLLGWNVFTLAVFGYDKTVAGTERRRVREATLLWLAAVGGAAGGIAGVYLFRHKTLKRRFLLWLWAGVVLQCMAGIALAILARR